MKLLPKKTLLVVSVLTGILVSGCTIDLTEESIKFLGFSFKQDSQLSLVKKAAEDETAVTSTYKDVSPSETFTMEISVLNPYEFEILSVTINQNKYQSYEFGVGSDSELIYIDETAPSEAGVYEYVLESIKYVEGTEIKYVSLTSLDSSISISVS